MSERLSKLIEQARHHKMTPDELFEQRVSFVYGQQDHDKPGSTKDEIRAHLADVYGDPAAIRREGRTQERAAIVVWLRGELTAIPRVGPDRTYRMGQQDALKLAIAAIERGDHLSPQQYAGDH